MSPPSLGNSPPRRHRPPQVSSILCKVQVWVMMSAAAMTYYLFSLDMFFGDRYDDITSNVNQEKIENMKLISTHLNDETNVKIPTKDLQGHHMTLEERVRYLELKTNAFINFGTDPFFGIQQQKNTCTKMTDLSAYGCDAGEGKCDGLYDHWICQDGLPKQGTKYEEKKLPPCLIYDFGIRAQPEFGKALAQTFGCEVHGFDPSPVSTDWWDSADAKELRSLPNYHFHPYGAGGSDGVVTLKEYNWGQVSILREPTWEFFCEGKKGNCDVKYRDSKSFSLPVKNLPTIMKELGHEGRTVDILKVDVEGSEYAFLENLLDSSGGCPKFINQITLEWHHFPWDARYGEGSNPSMNAISSLLHTCGLKLIWRQ